MMRVALTSMAITFGSAIPAAHAADVRRVAIFFTEWSAQIGQPASDAIGEAAAVAKTSRDGSVVVRGFADTTGTARATRLLAATRAQVVVDRLVADGVPADRIRSSSMGATRFAQEPLESHRATISIQVP